MGETELSLTIYGVWIHVGFTGIAEERCVDYNYGYHAVVKLFHF